MELLLVTGMSGAGRRSVLGALEDAGCATLDNMPVHLLEPLMDIETRLNPSRPRLAVGLDNRHHDFAEHFLQILDRLQAGPISVFLIFVDADDNTLVRRYSESRRPHFLTNSQGSVTQAVQLERKLVSGIKDLANVVLDTSKLSLSQLRQRMSEIMPELVVQDTILRLVSFGFKFGIPSDADIVLDARFLPNPFYVQELKPLTGKDPAVQEYLLNSGDFLAFLDHAENWIRWAWPLVQQEARAYHTVAIGCTGGMHRSVAITEMLAERLKNDVRRIVVQHRELA